MTGLVALFAATFLELCGLFMYGPLLLFTLKARGLDSAWIGLFGATQWLGMALATPFTAGWVRRLGARRALLLAAAVPLAACAGINLSDSVPLWAALYLIAGMAGALRWIVAEAMVAELAPPERRGRIVGLFETMVGLTFVVGPACLSALTGAGLDASWIRWLAVALLAAALAALLVSASGLGSAVMMVPVGELVDRFGRQATWTLCALLNLGATLLLPWVGEAGALAWLIALLWGGAGGGLYTVAMIDIGHRHQGVALVSATAVLVMSYTLGGMMAPALGGMALQWSPQTGFPLLLAAWALAGVLAITLMPDRRPRPPRPARSATSD